MQKFLFFIFLFFSLESLGDESFLSIKGKLKYSQDFSFSKQETSSLEFSEWGQSFHGDLNLEGNIGKHFVGKILATHQNKKLTCDGSYFKEAYLGVGLKDSFLIKVGCLPSYQLGWDEIRFDLTNSITSPLREKLYAQKYRKLIELNILSFGDFSLQAMEDEKSPNEQSQIALNFSWHEKFSFFSPIVQFSIYEAFSSYAYTIGTKFDFDPFLISIDAGRKKEKTKESHIYFNILTDYAFNSLLKAEKKDHISASFIGLIEKDKALKSEVHLAYLMNLGPHVSAFSDIFLELSEDLSFNMSLGLSAFL